MNNNKTSSSWDTLSIADKAEMMKVAIANGITSLPDIKEAYNRFEEGGYTNWLKQIALKKSREWGRTYEDVYNEMLNNDEYDYKVFYDNNREDAEDMLTADSNKHFNDSGKLPNHPTYSDESKVPNQPFKGGHWSTGPFGPNSSTYQLSQDQINNRWDIGRTLNYLSEAEDNGVVIKMPNGQLVRDADGTIFGGVLSNVEVTNKYAEGGKKYSKQWNSNKGAWAVTNNETGHTQNVYPNAIDALEMEITLPETVITAKENSPLGFSSNADYVGADRYTGKFGEDLAMAPLDLFGLNYKPIGTTSEIDYNTGRSTGIGGLVNVSPEFDMLMIGRTALNSITPRQYTKINNSPKYTSDFSMFKDLSDDTTKNMFAKMKQLEYGNMLAGRESRMPNKLSLIDAADKGVYRTTPQTAVDVFEKGVIPRMQEMRPWMRENEVKNLIVPEVTKGYTEFPASAFEKAGYDEATQGAYYEATGNIAVKKDGDLGINKIMTHEPRHGVQSSLPRTEEEQNLLKNSFGDLQEAFDSSEKDWLRGYNADSEFETLNLDARNTLIGYDRVAKLDAPLQNLIINKASDDAIIDAMHNADGYGKALVEHYEKTLGYVPKEKIDAWKESMKKVGMTLPFVIATDIVE